MTPLAAAESYVGKGMFPVPIPSRVKKPVIYDWPALWLTSSDLPHYFNGKAQNIGLILGDERGTTDIDLDCPEAIAAAPEFLPLTGMIFGRASARAAHHFYRCSPPIPSKKYIDPLVQNKDDATVLE